MNPILLLKIYYIGIPIALVIAGSWAGYEEGKYYGKLELCPADYLFIAAVSLFWPACVAIGLIWLVFAGPARLAHWISRRLRRG